MTPTSGPRIVFHLRFEGDGFQTVACGTADDAWRRIIEEHRHPDAHSAILLHSLFSDLLVNLVRGSKRVRLEAASRMSPPSETMLRALQYFDRRLLEAFSVEEAARHVNLRPRQFRDRFRRETGFSPVEYLERRRIEAAKEMLLKPNAVAAARGVLIASWSNRARRRCCATTASG